jgi:gas vesicle protein
MTEYAQNSPKMYSTMLANVERFRAEEEYLLTELTTNFSDSLVTKAPSMTWGALQVRVSGDPKSLEAQLGTLKTSLGQNAESIYADDKNARQDLKTLAERVAAARSAVAAAKDQITSWNASIALLRDAIQRLPAAVKSSSATRGAADLKTAIESAASRQIEYVDADGKTVKDTVSDVVRKRVPDLLDRLKEPGEDKKTLLSLLPDAPGLGLVLANLGLELAQAEQRRAQLRLEWCAAVAEVLDDALVQIRVAETLVESSKKWLSDARLDAQSNAFEGVLRARMQARAMLSQVKGEPRKADFQPVLSAINAASGELVNLRDIILAESITARVSSTTHVALARLEHIRSITESSINDSQYQALIRSGLAGLVRYHEGGLTSEDVANVIRLVQAIAVGVLTGKVD